VNVLALGGYVGVSYFGVTHGLGGYGPAFPTPPVLPPAPLVIPTLLLTDSTPSAQAVPLFRTFREIEAELERARGQAARPGPAVPPFVTVSSEPVEPARVVMRFSPPQALIQVRATTPPEEVVPKPSARVRAKPKTPSVSAVVPPPEPPSKPSARIRAKPAKAPAVVTVDTPPKPKGPTRPRIKQGKK
jgi:hypothetical protein